MERHAGSVRMGGRLAYVAQQAWIVNDSLQSNVLFGQELNERRWDDCVHACSLQQDLEVRLVHHNLGLHVRALIHIFPCVLQQKL